MAVAKINVNTDAETKKAAEDVFNAVGMNMTTAINVFLKKAIQYKGIPFDVCVEVPNETTLAAFKEAEKIMSDPKRKGYKSIDELKAALDK
ncbi:MAG: type II toxin-antitoxin system RelB/DinJ family antitoxin [Clostridia bacterium]|nr:type II toxin-antitoxin system RelB/DinJ family antitoxin [Clostridia bacterium]